MPHPPWRSHAVTLAAVVLSVAMTSPCADGYIVTNAHVVANAQRVQIVIPATRHDGPLQAALNARTSVHNARIVGLAQA